MNNLEELKIKMQEGVVNFSYKKKDGSIREAKGTLKSDYFGYIPEGKSTPSDSVFVYWDMDKNSFRCFIKESFIGISE